MNKILTICLFILFINLHANAQTGHVLNGAGARSFGMAGVGTAKSTNPTAALQWSPASITQIPTSIEFSSSLISLNTKNYAELDLFYLDPNAPQGTILAGELNDETGNTYLPTLSFVYNPKSEWSFGLTAAGIGGFGVDFRQSASSPLSLLFGDLFSSYKLFQISFTSAYQLTDKLAVAISPTVNIASLELGPIVTTTPFLGAQGILFPAKDEARAIGYGVHVGLTYLVNESLSVGLLYKSKQEFEDFEYDETNGAGSRSKTALDYPMILAAGLSYSGINKTAIALDFRYVDFSSTDGFSNTGYGADFSVKGFGWDNSYFLGLGIERSLSDVLIIRSGYSYSTNPIDDEVSFFSTVAPASVQHSIGVGASYACSGKIDISVGYHHGFENEINGPIILPTSEGGQAVPSISRSVLSTDLFSLDIAFKL